MAFPDAPSGQDFVEAGAYRGRSSICDWSSNDRNRSRTARRRSRSRLTSTKQSGVNGCSSYAPAVPSLQERARRALSYQGASPEERDLREGLIRAEQPAHATYKGNRYEGRLTGDGKLAVEGQQPTSLSTAAKAICGRPVNGWAFWKVEEDGKPVKLAVLRARLNGSGRHIAV